MKHLKNVVVHNSWHFCDGISRDNFRNSHEECFYLCGGLKENGRHRLIESDIIRRRGLAGVGVFLLEKVCR